MNAWTDSELSDRHLYTEKITLPKFGTQWIVGRQSLLNYADDGYRLAHSLAAGKTRKDAVLAAMDVLGA